MKKQVKKREKKRKANEELDEVKKFYKISQILHSGKKVKLYPRPIYCSQRKGLELGLERFKNEGNPVQIEVMPLKQDEQARELLNATEEDLLKYTR